MYRRLLVAVGAIVVAISLAQAQEKTLTIPSVEISKDLKVYTGTAELIAAGNEVIDVLKTAKFSERQFREKTSESCKVEHFGNVYRGSMVFQLIYHFTVTKLEHGYMNANFCCDRPVALTRPDRIALLSVLQPSFIRELLQLRTRLSALPTPVRQSLAAFFQELRQYRQYYGFMQRGTQKFNNVETIIERMDDDYPSVTKLLDEADGLLIGGVDKSTLPLAKIREFKNKESRSKFQLAGDLRVLANDNKDVWSRSVSPCLDGWSENGEPGEVVSLTLGGDNPVTKELDSSPTLFMTLFWRRRELEGTSGIATFVIDQAINALKAEN